MEYDLADNFNFAMAFVKISEGGTNTDPVDRGGITRWGISQKTYPHLDILNLTEEDARELYRKDFWLANHCHEFPRQLATVLFDSSVNCGLTSAGKWLQEGCNKFAAGLKVDGDIGPKTMREASLIDPDGLTLSIIAGRLARYASLLKTHPKQIKFIRGWVDRVAKLIFYTL